MPGYNRLSDICLAITSQIKSPSFAEALYLVRVTDSRWNHFVPSLYLLHSKLERFGFAFINDKVVYLGDKEFGDV